MEDITSKVEEKECDEIDALLKSLLKINLLTDIDCSTITSKTNLSEKQSAIYRVIMSKGKEDASDLTERFRTLYFTIHTGKMSTPKNSPDYKVEDYKLMPLIPSILNRGNPLLDNTVIKCILGYLTLSDIKNCRLVCHPWNFAAEIFLRKLSIIHFRSTVLPPADFLKISQLSLPDLSFRSFLFSKDRKSPLSTQELEKFFISWGKNIEEMKLERICLKDEHNPEAMLEDYDMSSWISKMSNVNSVKIRSEYPKDGICKATCLDISANTLTTVKNIFLEESSIIITRMAPLNIYLRNVSFVREMNEDLQTFCFNDFVDFSQALNICLIRKSQFAGQEKFDMGNLIFNLVQLHLLKVTVENWPQATGLVQFLHLRGIPFTQKNWLKIKYLKFLRCEIDLSVLPQTIERMWLLEYTEVACTKKLNLPNLSFLSFQLVNGSSKFLSKFDSCRNLIELEIGRDTFDDCEPGPWTFKISWVPKSVRRMKITTLELELINDCIRNLDTLILMDYEGSISPFTNFEKLTTHVKADVLVLVCNEKMEIDTSDIIKLVLANKMSQKIIIGSHYDLHKTTSFEGSVFSRYVNSKSNYYQFEQQIGKAITPEEFEAFIHLENEECPTPFFSDKNMGFPITKNCY